MTPAEIEALKAALKKQRKHQTIANVLIAVFTLIIIVAVGYMVSRM